MLRFFNVPNIVTVARLVTGLGMVWFASRGRLHLAMVALIVSGLSDLFDGWVARRFALSDEHQRFGARLDSLCDACAFGFAPAASLYLLGYDAHWEVFSQVALVVAAVWRLAYFDVVGLLPGGKHYAGLPVTFVGLFLPLGALASAYSASAGRHVLSGLTLPLALAMVAPVPIRKPFGIWYAVLFAAAVAAIAVHLLLWVGASA